ncbi:hypothetical protein [Haloferula sp. BvORR071]|uniref:hypothetical protein n=1 Tax=Haloferula sp. BvORR071 TaxID=1396141 RepID=UPI0005539E83|nr:hypothetical protein [Haloferula sp. BvORR071]
MNSVLTQPPPDAPEPPPDHYPRRFLWFKAIAIIGLVFVLLSLGLGLMNMVRSRATTTSAVYNATEVGKALANFEASYGKFPDASTAAAVSAKTSTPLTLGSSTANQLFRQLLVTMPHPSEEIFWAETSITPKPPDEIFTSNSTALRPGESAFAYIAGLSSSSGPTTPVLVCPLLPGSLLFDPKPFHGQAVVLHADHSVAVYPIDPTGHVLMGSLDIFDPRQAFWHGKAPDIKWPE